ncbi:uncharacterized protein G2W53_003961 [Senna tora]|uniref:Uncharacterized protein n=1 Tax=Senna tora TaxID=362788 RepID=A0A834XEE8_9FABA|nr:uncharacterized protein G2W53_003961 [Senna tora]
MLKPSYLFNKLSMTPSSPELPLKIHRKTHGKYCTRNSRVIKAHEAKINKIVEKNEEQAFQVKGGSLHQNRVLAEVMEEVAFEAEGAIEIQVEGKGTVAVQTSNDPISFNEVTTKEEWRFAMEEEIKAN